jgi:hypothetical protein
MTDCQFTDMMNNVQKEKLAQLQLKSHHAKLTSFVQNEVLTEKLKQFFFDNNETQFSLCPSLMAIIQY